MSPKYTLSHLTYTPNEGFLYNQTVLVLKFTPIESFTGFFRIIYTVDSSNVAEDIVLFQTEPQLYEEGALTELKVHLDFSVLRENFDEHILYNIATLSILAYSTSDTDSITMKTSSEPFEKYISVVNVLKRDFGVDPRRSIFSPF